MANQQQKPTPRQLSHLIKGPKKRKAAYDPYPELRRVLDIKHTTKRPRVAAVAPDPVIPSATTAAAAAAAAASKSTGPLLVSQVARLSDSSSAVFNVSSAQQFVSVDDFMRIDDGGGGASDMLALLQQAGMVASSSGPVLGTDAATQRAPDRHRQAGTVLTGNQAASAYCALRPRSTLWSRQRETVEFMKHLEHDRLLGSGGGLVGNEMGQGKTLEVLAFIMESLQDLCRRTGKPFGSPTLVVMPKTLLDQWRAEIIKHFPPRTFSVLVLSEMQNTNLSPETIAAQYNLVLTTYPTISTAYRSLAPSAKRRSNYSVLYHVTWERVIADEGHLFANSETCRFAAMCALRSHHRWILTGTPVLNDVHNVLAELRFMGVSNDYLPVIATVRNERVTGTIAAGRIAERQRSAQNDRDNFSYLLCIRQILGQLMIRNRETRHRFTRTVAIEHFETQAEQDIYDYYTKRFYDTCMALQKRGQEPSAPPPPPPEDDDEDEEPIDPLLEEGEIDTSLETPPRTVRRMVTVDILRLRQICASPETVCEMEIPPHLLVDAGFAPTLRARINTPQRIAAHANATHVRQGVPTLAYLAAAVLFTEKAPILPLSEPDAFSDVTWIHEQVRASQWAELVPRRDVYDRLHNVAMSVRRRIIPYFGTKTRLFARYFMHKIPPGEKYIILSEWVRTLHNMQEAFTYLGAKALLITGKHTSAERSEILRQSETDPNARVLLISLHIGSYGLNIPWANHVSQTALWWNPHTEDQARFRVLRPEQTRHCYFYNVVMSKTVEEDVLRMSNEKQYISRLLLENDAATLDFIRATQARLEQADLDSGTTVLVSDADTDAQKQVNASLASALSVLLGQTYAATSETTDKAVQFLGKRTVPNLANLVARILTPEAETQ